MLFGAALTDAGGAPGAFDMRAVLVAEVFEGGDDGVGGALAEAAETGRADEIAELLEHFEVGGGGFAARDFLEEAVHLLGPGAAWNALAAGLGHAELHEVF